MSRAAPAGSILLSSRRRSTGGGGGGGAWIQSFTVGSLRNDFDGNVGCEFIPSATMTVTELGRWVVAGNSQSHDIKIWDSAGTTVLATIPVNTAGQPAGAFAYVPLVTPLVLTIGSIYYLTTFETVGGDQWYDQTSATSTTDAVLWGSAFGSNAGVANFGQNFLCYGVPNFKYTL